MSDHTAIEWTDATWNPVTGCTKVSPGCANCYIERTPPFRMEGRWFRRPEVVRLANGRLLLAPESTTGVRLHPDRLDQPLRWRKPRRIFVCSLSDLFHADVSDYFIRDLLGVIACAPQHTFQILTKRPERAREILGDRNAPVLCARQAASRGLALDDHFDVWPLPNVWLGVSIENARYTWRADVLREIPAAVRFISAEPLLGSLFDDDEEKRCPECDTELYLGHDPECSGIPDPRRRKNLDLFGIDWVIVGGESGPGARPMHPAWARELRDACLCPHCGGAGWTTGMGHAAECYHTGECYCSGVPEQIGCDTCAGQGVLAAFFMKQMGSAWASENVLGFSDPKGSNQDYWPADLRIREFPRGAV